MGRTKLHSHMPMQVPKYYILLEWACCLLFTKAMSSLIKNHRFLRWICSPPLKRTLKISYLIYQSRGGASRICLTYQVALCHSDADFEEYAQTYHEFLNQTLFVQQCRGPLPIHFTVWKLMGHTKQ